MKVGDLVRYRHRDLGLFVIIKILHNDWTRILRLEDSKVFIDKVYSLEAVKKCP